MLRPEGAVKVSDVPRFEQLKGSVLLGMDAFGNVRVNGSSSGIGAEEVMALTQMCTQTINSIRKARMDARRQV